MGGIFGTGEDLGTTTQDMVFLSGETDWVFGVDLDTREVRDPGPYTALGVMAGGRAALEHVYGSGELSGRSILIEGVGDVGAPLARFAAEAGADVLIVDTDPSTAAEVAAETGGRVVAPEAAHTEPCDVYAPCAIAGTLNRDSIPSLGCRIVAGSANAQLEEPEDATRLHERDILYAPDYVVNAGGATAFGALAEGVTDDAEIRERIERIHDILMEVFEEADQRDESPVHAARSRVDKVLDRGRKAPTATDAEVLGAVS